MTLAAMLTDTHATAHEMTTEEVRADFLRHVRRMIDYWATQPRAVTTRSRLEGLAQSILITIDGSNAGGAAFILAPCPHPDDREYCRRSGVDWWPENHAAAVRANIAGELHEHLFRQGDA